MTRDEAIKILEQMQRGKIRDIEDYCFDAVDIAIEALEQPEIIRCNDCHYYNGERCDMHKMMTDQTDYCSYAVGKYGEDET